jgi:hypothetical protein
MSISLGKTYSRLGKLVDGGSQEVIRSVASGIERTLIIGKENDHVGLGRESGGSQESPKQEE